MQNVEDWFNVIPQEWRTQWEMTNQMEQWILKEHKHRWNNEIYKRSVIHITALEDQDDTSDYDRLYIEMLIRLLIIDYEELSMTGEGTDELAIQKIIQHYQRIDDIINGNNAYSKWQKDHEKGIRVNEKMTINHTERGDLLRKFLLYLPWNTCLKKKV